MNLQSHLLVLKPCPPSGGNTHQVPSIAPFGIETCANRKYQTKRRFLQSHLLVLKLGKKNAIITQFRAFNRTFWYWNCWHLLIPCAPNRLQSHLLVLKLDSMIAAKFSDNPSIAPFGIETFITLNRLVFWCSPSIAPFGIETGTDCGFVRRPKTFNRTFWYWNLFRENNQLDLFWPSIAPFGIETTFCCDTSKVSFRTFNRTFWYWNFSRRAFVLPANPTFNRTFWYWNPSPLYDWGAI